MVVSDEIIIVADCLSYYSKELCLSLQSVQLILMCQCYIIHSIFKLLSINMRLKIYREGVYFNMNQLKVRMNF